MHETENPKKRELGVDGKIILKWFIKKSVLDVDYGNVNWIDAA
jgi:hypothetical protein